MPVLLVADGQVDVLQLRGLAVALLPLGVEPAPAQGERLLASKLLVSGGQADGLH